MTLLLVCLSGVKPSSVDDKSDPECERTSERASEGSRVTQKGLEISDQFSEFTIFMILLPLLLSVSILHLGRPDSSVNILPFPTRLAVNNVSENICQLGSQARRSQI